MTAETCAHVAMAGGAFESPSCSAKTLRYGSSAKIGSSKAASTLGRSVEMSYQASCVSGWLSQRTNFHEASRLSRLSLSPKTARLPPPVNEVRDSAPGTIATANLSSNSGPPCSRSRLTWNGPLKNEPTEPSMNSCSISPPSSRTGSEMPSSKKLL